MIKAICFDLDGMYFTPEGKRGFERSLVNLGIPEVDVKYVLYKSPEMLQFVLGKLSEDQFWDFARMYWKQNLSNQEFAQLWIKDYAIDSNVRDYVLKARQKGYLSCVCSNNNSSRVRALEERFHFLDDFDVKVFSHEVGFVKPSPVLPGTEIYKILIERAGVQPEELIYADDNPERIQGAADLGIKTFVYEGFEQFKEKLKNFGVSIT